MAQWQRVYACCASGISPACASAASVAVVLKAPVMLMAASCWMRPIHLDVPTEPLLMVSEFPV